jgi:hypothetical protein
MTSIGRNGSIAFFKTHLPTVPRCFKPFGNPRRKVNQVQVQKRHARLDAGGHRHLIRVDQIVNRQEETLFQGEHLIERTRPAGNASRKSSIG